MALDKVRLAPVGLGRWAHVLAGAAQRGDVIELVSCFGRSADKRATFATQFGIPRSAATYRELLDDPEVEGVVITTPNDTHKAFVEEAAEAGKAVFVEKPLAHTLADAVAIADTVDRVAATLAVGHSARRLSGHRVMKRCIDEGIVGEVSLVEANFSTPAGLQLTPDKWRWYAAGSPGGAFIQLGVHHADTLQYLLGPVRAVSAHVRKLYTKSEVPDAVMALVEFESGPLGYLGTGWASPGVFTMNLLGTKTNLFYDVSQAHWAESHLIDDHSSLSSQALGGERGEVALHPTDAFREQLEEFALAIRGRAAVEVGATEAIGALAVVAAALESSNREGAAVTLHEVIEQARAGAANGS